jgi:predicted CXXCH cytochrome family protein
VARAGAGLAFACGVALAAPPAAGAPGYVGGAACVPCHEREAKLWRGSDHDRAMEQADASSVRGDFRSRTFVKDGVTTTFSRRDGKYVIRTDGPDGRLHDYPVAYTFGVDPLQQYLLPFPGGRYQALGVAWDARPAAAGGQRWFHLYPKERMTHRHPLHWTGPQQNWNFMCADCHSTNLEKGYRPAEDRFETTWTDVDVACEACHGPGAGHVTWAAGARRGPADPDPRRGPAFRISEPGSWTVAPGESIARRSPPRSSRAEVETCGRCHARRSQIWGDYRYGEPLAQAYRVALLDEPLYHADGQIRDEVYEYGSFLQSRMYAAGVTCSDCHDPHAGRLRAEGNAVCATCHPPARFDGPQHHFHPAGTPGARCVSCHMIERVYMGVDARRDHGFRVPRPDLGAKLGTPDACTDCHRGKPARWAADAVARWYPRGRSGTWHWAEALHAGRVSDAAAEGELVRAVGDAAVPAIVRATALSLLARHLTPRSLPVLRRGLDDGDPLVRRAAAEGLEVLAPADRIGLGVPLLRDPVRTVRLEATASLLDVPRDAFTPEQSAALDGAIAEFRQVQAFNADRAEANANLGMLEARLGNAVAAETAFETAIRRDPTFVPAYVHLADLHRGQGRDADGERVLRRALDLAPDAADAHEALGLCLVRQKRLRDAIPELAKAARLQPDVARYAYVHAIALHETGDVRGAIGVLARAHERHPASRDVLVALAQYEAEAGHREAAVGWARRLVALSPEDPEARRLLERLERPASKGPGVP